MAESMSKYGVTFHYLKKAHKSETQQIGLGSTLDPFVKGKQ